MDPVRRYRKAYEAMIHASQLWEARLNQEFEGDVESTTEGEEPVAVLENDDPDSMEWTPTGTGGVATPPTTCGPPPTTSKNMRHLLPNGGDGEYRVQDQGNDAVLLHKLQEGVIMDECINKLVRDMPDILSYENSATFTPSTIEVADRKLLEKYRRLLGYRKDPAKRKSIKLGFDPADLIKKQAVTFAKDATTQASTLDNDIHPVFRAENFHGCPDAVYEVLKPALQLATHMLFSRGTSIFWHTLVFGERKPCQTTSDEYGQPCYRIRDDVAWTEENAASFKSFLDKQLDTVHFMFHRDPLPPDPAYASMGLVADYKNGLMRKLDSKCHTSKICLHSDFYTTAKKLSLLQYPDPAMVLRFNLFLAVCLVHEMAHFIEVSGPHHEHPLGEPEVFFNDNTWTESGIAFELKVFGGRLHPISSRVDCGLGLAVLSYPLKEVYELEENVLYTLPMDYITKMQQKETWEQDFSALSPEPFRVPRTGCRSIEINGANLMVWEDEKDADISDHIDGKDTTFHRMDDGQIVKNPNSSNRKPQRQPEVKRWAPYGRQKKPGIDPVACVSKELPEDGTKEEAEKEEKEVEAVVEAGELDREVETNGDKDEDML